jgi:hypothetical protein
MQHRPLKRRRDLCDRAPTAGEIQAGEIQAGEIQAGEISGQEICG